MKSPRHVMGLAHSDAELARMVVNIAEASQVVETLICISENGLFAQHLSRLAGPFRVVATTPNGETFKTLTTAGIDVIRLPLRTADKYTQVRHAISVVLRSAAVSIGDLVVCAIGQDVYPEEGTLIVLTEIEASIQKLAVSDLLKLTDGIQPLVLEAVVTVACKISRAVKRGNRMGAIFMLGDSMNVLEGSRQLIPNPFQGHDKNKRMVTNPDIHHALVELSKLDGAFVLRGDGFVQSAGVFLASPPLQAELVSGLGTRHAAAAAVTMRTRATAIIVSATDGHVRAFSGGKLVLQIDPEVALGQMNMEEFGQKQAP